MYISRVLVVLLSMFSLIQCANPGSPTGGPKDEKAPIMLSSKPENKTVNFEADEIVIKFDELVKFKDLNKQLIISPPMKHDPEIKPTASAMDRVNIKILDTLKENTTYTINFGDALRDNNEGNVFSNFRYVFSTGDYIDSLILRGKIGDAFKNDFAKGVMVMLYKIDSTFTDSTIFTNTPTYVTSTIKSDTFRIENIKKGKYQLIALEEKTRTLKFNPAQDKIAFLQEYITIPDTNKYLLKLYKQAPDFKMKRPIHKGTGQISFDLLGNSQDVEIKRILPIKNDTVIDMWEYSKYRDTINYWFSARESDSIVFLVKSDMNDLNDTVSVSLKKQKEIKASFTPKNINLVPKKRVNILSNFPISAFETDSIEVLNLKDSTEVNTKISIEDKYNLKIDFEPMYESKYGIKLYPGAITNFFGDTNDTLNFMASVKKKTEFGEIVLKITNIASYPIIVDLVKAKGLKTVERIYAKENQDFIFSQLLPGEYTVRLIYDDNGNERWDPGNYLQHLQPEEVKYFSGVINLKANWDIQQEWILE